MKNITKKIALELFNKENDPLFEEFISEQILSSKSSLEEDPYFTISHKSMVLDIWKKDENSFELVKSVLPGMQNSGKDFVKKLKKEELLKELFRFIEGFINEDKIKRDSRDK